MENKHTSVGKAALHHGAILGVALIILSLIFHFAGFALEDWTKYVTWIVMIAYLVYATKSFRDENRGGFLTYGQGLGFGTLTFLITGLISSVYSFIYVKLINPAFINEIMEKSYEQMLERGMAEEQIEMALSYQEPWMMPSMIIFPFIGTVFMGFIFSLIISAVFKRAED
jgi:hypothetical protein